MIDNLVANSATIGVVVSLMMYGFGVWLRDKTRIDAFNPLLISIVSVIGFLLLFRIDFESFEKSARYLSYLLTPATVCLAIPLYKELEILKKNLVAIFIGVLSGVLASMGSVLLLAHLFGMSHEEYVTMLPKSITTAIGMGVSEELGGYVTITVAVIIVTGIVGNMIAVFWCRLLRIKSPISRGLAIGTSAHAIGTAKAMTLGKIEGAMSSLAIVVSGLMTVILASVFAMFLT
jgi:predicted murein hydrolase (TIGR00659 family)